MTTATLSSPPRLRLLCALLLCLSGGLAVAQTPQSPQATLSRADFNRIKSEFLGLYGRGDHPKAAEVALKIPVQSQDLDANTRMKIAQSLAWTGHPEQALAHYHLLLGTPYEATARVAIGNTVRWDGELEQARKHFVRAIQLEPKNKDAADALDQVMRELRPRTKVNLGRSLDSGDMDRRVLTIAHSWRDASNTQIFGVETQATRSKYETPHLDIRQQDVTLRYQNTELQLRPALHLNLQAKPHGGTFGGVSVSPKGTPFTATAERLNWGISGLSARALDKQMTADHYALSAVGSLGWAFGRARVEQFHISDSNTITASSWYLQPNWRPLGSSIKPYLSVETRKAKFNTLDYWSQVAGSGTGGIGLLGEWGDADLAAYLAAQASRRLYGDSGNGWSLSGGVQHWFAKDYAIGANFWAMKSVRDGAVYRAHNIGITGEKLW